MRNKKVFLIVLFISACATDQSEQVITDLRKLEFSRISTPGIFENYIEHENAEVRAQVALTIARIQDSNHVAVLKRLVKDKNKHVAKTAIFGLGQIGSNECFAFLQQLNNQTENKQYKSDIIEALARCNSKAALPLLQSMLPDLPDSLIILALNGIAFNTPKEKRTDLGHEIRSYLEYDNADIKRAAAYYFSRNPSPVAIKELLATQFPVGSTANKYRLSAINHVLSNKILMTWDSLTVDSLRSDVIWQLQNRDISWQNKLQYLSLLANFSDSISVNAATEFLKNENPHLRKMAINVLGEQKDPRLKTILLDYYNQANWNEKGQIIQLLADMDRNLAYRLIQQNLDQGTLYFKQQLLKGLARINDRESVRQLRQFLIVPNDRLNFTAFNELAELRRIREKDTQQFLASGKLIQTTISAYLIAEHPQRGRLTDLIAAYEKFTEPEGNDALYAIILAIGALKTKESIPFLNAALRQTKSSLLADQIIKILNELEVTGITKPEIKDSLFVPDTILAGKDPVYASVETDKGSIRFELWPDIAPATVSNFVFLSKKEYFNNLTFHRVIGDFVVQGGDPTGTGWGGPGYSIPCEYSDLEFKRGTVGMATAGKDTGGSQFFICHSEQPHLNRRYTIFGQVVEGMTVVDQIEIDDIIRRISIIQ